MILLSSSDFFSIVFCITMFLSKTLNVSNGLDPDQDRQKIGPDLGSNCLQR